MPIDASQSVVRPDGRPAIAFPRHACDAHVHVFGPQARFPFAAGRTFTPADSPKETLFDLHARLGVERCVVVQSGCHGIDNAVTEDVLAAKGGAYRGVALLPTNVSEAELHRLDAAGFRAVRFNYMGHLGKATPIDEVVKFSARLAPLGWHLLVHCEPALIDEVVRGLARSPVPVVIDHMGRIDASGGIDQPEFRALRAGLCDERFWVKVSGCDRCSRTGPPYADALPFARMLVAEFGDRVLWGTDFPHPNITGPVPDDSLLADLVADIAPHRAQRQALLVDNPQRLYRFTA